jgi:hypothetical protein
LLRFRRWRPDPRGTSVPTGAAGPALLVPSASNVAGRELRCAKGGTARGIPPLALQRPSALPCAASCRTGRLVVCERADIRFIGTPGCRVER